MRKLYYILLVCIVFCSLTLYAHSGRTDSQGGHYNRKTGEYHYHTPKSSSVPKSSTPSQPVTKSSSVPKSSTPSRPVTTQTKPVSITENHWQVALNNKVFKGKLEAPLSSGRVDILTDTLVIEVDKVSKYAGGIYQVLKYAEATEKKPVLALYIDGEKDGYELLQQADKLCNEKGVELLLINSVVSVNDLITLVWIANNDTTESEGVSESKSESELKYWLNIPSNVRHNSSCRYYMNTKNGRKCTKSEGRACGICGG